MILQTILRKDVVGVFEALELAAGGRAISTVIEWLKPELVCEAN